MENVTCDRGRGRWLRDRGLVSAIFPSLSSWDVSARFFKTPKAPPVTTTDGSETNGSQSSSHTPRQTNSQNDHFPDVLEKPYIRLFIFLDHLFSQGSIQVAATLAIMAQIVRSAKSGNKWTENELIGFNITVNTVDVQTFFNVAQLPPTNVSPVILNNVDAPPPPAVLTKDEYLFFTYLERAENALECCVDDLAGHILRMLDFDDVVHRRSLAIKKELSFTMCGETVYAKPDYTVMDHDNYALLVQEDKVSYLAIFSDVP